MNPSTSTIMLIIFAFNWQNYGFLPSYIITYSFTKCAFADCHAMVTVALFSEMLWWSHNILRAGSTKSSTTKNSGAMLFSLLKEVPSSNNSIVWHTIIKPSFSILLQPDNLELLTLRLSSAIFHHQNISILIVLHCFVSIFSQFKCVPPRKPFVPIFCIIMTAVVQMSKTFKLIW